MNIGTGRGGADGGKNRQNISCPIITPALPSVSESGRPACTAALLMLPKANIQLFVRRCGFQFQEALTQGIDQQHDG